MNYYVLAVRKLVTETGLIVCQYMSIRSTIGYDSNS